MDIESLLEQTDIPTWEYRVERPDQSRDDICIPLLNELGKQGWELVGVTQYRMIFKRMAGLLSLGGEAG